MVPKGWTLGTLKDLADTIMGYAFRSEDFVPTGIPLLRMGNLYQNTLDLNRNPVYLPDSFKVDYKRFLVSPGDLVMSMTGTMGKRDYGFTVEIPSNTQCSLLNQRVLKIVPKNNASSGYILNLLRSELILSVLYSFPGGTKQANLSAKQLQELPVLIPPELEQKKIAKILSTWDNAISVTEKLLANSQQQKKALMQQLLTGKKRLLDENGVRFSGDWNSSKLGDLFNFKKGKGLSKSDLSESGINKCILYGELYTKYAEIAYEVISRTNSSDGQLSEPGDILLPASTTTSGIDLANATALSEGGILLGGDINILRPKVRLSSPFLAYFLTHMKKNEISSRAQGITIIHLYGGDLKSIDIVLPSTVQEQKKIATVLSAADAEISTLEKKLACLRDEKKALMQQLLTGKRRVKVDEAVTE